MLVIVSNTDCAAPLVEVWRGPIVESLHRGHLVAVDGAGQAVAELGAPQTVTFIRSSGKPFQAIPLITSGAADRFGFTDQEIAIACGSHSGEPIHVETVQSMLKKIGLGEDALKCGVHEPFSVEVVRELAGSSNRRTSCKTIAQGSMPECWPLRSTWVRLSRVMTSLRIRFSG